MAILKSGSIWASHIRYLNDTSEYEHMVQTIDKRVCVLQQETMNEGLRGANRIASLNAIRDLLKRGVNKISYVASFSAKRDDLSQWRGYCPPGLGVSIGFRSSAITAAITPESEDHSALVPGRLGRVIYMQSDEGESFDRWIEAACEEPDNQEAFTRPGTFKVTIDMAAAFYKDVSFKDEYEWRAIMGRSSANGEPAKISFRMGKSTLVPYQEIKLGRLPREFISEIVVGPSPNLSLSAKAVRQLLHVIDGRSEVEVTKSEVPFRHW
jgi:hypothetical protein